MDKKMNCSLIMIAIEQQSFFHVPNKDHSFETGLDQFIQLIKTCKVQNETIYCIIPCFVKLKPIFRTQVNSFQVFIPHLNTFCRTDRAKRINKFFNPGLEKVLQTLAWD